MIKAFQKMFAKYIDQDITQCYDEMNNLAQEYKLRIAILDPNSPPNIDVEYDRLNVHTDADGKIKRFSKG